MPLHLRSLQVERSASVSWKLVPWWKWHWHHWSRHVQKIFSSWSFQWPVLLTVTFLMVSSPSCNAVFMQALLSLCREICLLAYHLHKTFNTYYNKTVNNFIKHRAENPLKYTHKNTTICIHTYMHMHACLNTHTQCTHTHAHAHRHTHTTTHTHTHTQNTTQQHTQHTHTHTQRNHLDHITIKQTFPVQK